MEQEPRIARHELLSIFSGVFLMSSLSWGGLALIAQLQQRFVQKQQRLSQDEFNCLLSLAWSLPGPVAGNLAVMSGYAMAGARGAWAAGLASYLPFFISMTALAYAYLHGLQAVAPAMMRPLFLAVLLALIGVTCFRQVKPIVRNPRLLSVSLASLTALLLFPQTLTFVLVLAVSSLVGVMSAVEPASRNIKWSWPNLGLRSFGMLLVVSLAVGAFVFIEPGVSVLSDLLLYAGASLALFGGGFSAVPVLKTVFLRPDDQAMLDAFNTAFVFSSISPGPLLNVVPFLGYVQAGLVWAAASSFAFFFLPGSIAVAAYRYRVKLLGNVVFESVLRYLGACSVAFIVFAFVNIAKVTEPGVATVLAFVLSVVFLTRYQQPVWRLYLGAALLAVALG
jgi:chromate transporter